MPCRRQLARAQAFDVRARRRFCCASWRHRNLGGTYRAIDLGPARASHQTRGDRRHCRLLAAVAAAFRAYAGAAIYPVFLGGPLSCRRKDRGYCSDDRNRRGQGRGSRHSQGDRRSALMKACFWALKLAQMIKATAEEVEGKVTLNCDPV